GEGSEVIVDAAIDYIARNQKTGKPFFTVIWFGSPHEPYSGLDKDLSPYDPMVDAYPGRSV
ncbi:MAG: N-acetylgalactosamine-6-sulfatase, partial [Verrucomicrobiae bacterium]|nr:N-acetylgalactosamine-6-sulfatase [Verrucomicrobiae bacterium]NNJ87157.1 N-acetylgalactosamine-6-sulfatase [Akkermansiaceae bacterium]